MIKVLSFCSLLLTSAAAIAQQPLAPLTVEKIMRDPKWIGTSPAAPQWSMDSRTLYFTWNPDQAPDDSLYLITLTTTTPVKATVADKQNRVAATALTWNTGRTAYVYAKDGDICYADVKSGITRRILQTTEAETNPQFSFSDTKIVYARSQNLYAWDIATGETWQLTNIKTGPAAPKKESTNPQEDWLKKDQLNYMEVLHTRKEKREAADKYTKDTRPKELRSIPLDDKQLQGLAISPDGRFISYRLVKTPANAKATIVPAYVTETGFTTDIPARSKVGAPQGASEFFLYDRLQDTILVLKADSLPGIADLPDYLADYPKQLDEKKKKPANRSVTFFSPVWSPRGTYAVLDIRSDDNKDRWLMLWDAARYRLTLLDRQRDEAWIGGPGISGSGIGWIDENTVWYQSEATGYSHLYTINAGSGKKTALTAGRYEVQQVRLSVDKKYFYLVTNEVHPGEKQFYRLPVSGGQAERITTLTGANDVVMSPDEKWLAILYSYSNKPWELYLQENKVNGRAQQLTFRAQSDTFKAYPWRDPELISFTARDGATVYARLYKPANPHPNRPAVLFVHGAGYLQNAHRWWSSYFREYMFNNLLADNGYYVMDIDYRGSAGYGRDWRTGIYRYMGGKDLTDHVDAADYLVKNYGVNPAHVGLYGGSYGGFITLMGLFTEPGVFAAGAALRPVTDWANYNHGYTSNILNEPFTDSLAYRRSSPYYFAEGLKGHLLICHGMMDINVHYQDAVKLAQRLIELGKEDWELASYPMEDHGFVEPSSWTDEYKRIFKLFEEVLKK
ncbi:MAG: prolyl oligopeptidase family serine peptidase [Chitinophagaceae bacterium]